MMKKKYHSKNVYQRDNKTLKPEFIGNTNNVRMRVVDQTVLDKLLLNDTICLSHFKTLDKLLGDYNKSGLVGVKAMNYMPRVVGDNKNFDRHNLLRSKVMGCLKYVKKELHKQHYIILNKLLSNQELLSKDLEWLGNEENVESLSTIIDKFYLMWNNS
tara:strand:+ start:12 stop:485 length:474 start_codon:yes stop_codon:yes gene_type:complete